MPTLCKRAHVFISSLSSTFDRCVLLMVVNAKVIYKMKATIEPSPRLPMKFRETYVQETILKRNIDKPKAMRTRQSV